MGKASWLAAILAICVGACGQNGMFGGGSGAADAMRRAVEQRAGGPYAPDERDFYTANLVRRGYYTAIPNPDAQPWFAIALTPEGARKLASAQAHGVAALADVLVGPLECWTNEDVRNCAADVIVQLAPTAEFAPLFDGGPLSLQGRMTASLDPRVGEWRVTDARFERSDFRREMADFVRAAFGPPLREPPIELAAAIADAQAQAYDQIEQRLRPTIYRNGDVVVMPQRQIEFLRRRVHGVSWQALFDTCANERTAGGGWRMAQNHEFQNALANGRPLDAPDGRIWGETLAYADDSANSRANQLWFNTFYWNGRAQRGTLDEILSPSTRLRGRDLYVESISINRSGGVGGWGGSIPETTMQEAFSSRTDAEDDHLFRRLTRTPHQDGGRPRTLCVRQSRAAAPQR